MRTRREPGRQTGGVTAFQLVEVCLSRVHDVHEFWQRPRPVECAKASAPGPAQCRVVESDVDRRLGVGHRER